MTRTHTLTGTDVGCYVPLVLLVLCHLVNADSGLEMTGPKIVDVVHKYGGKGYRITCKVRPGALESETMAYWLVDDNFVDSVYSDGRVKTVEGRNSRGLLRTTLWFNNILRKDFSFTFSCVALNPAGYDRKNTTAMRPCRNTGKGINYEGNL
ncbi:interleukin-1 receptor type 2-like [Hoplias malabaricus]|uniref:interleukin-1 receptor type 2-like n=1 Tax=Hoplias malabaricus TaxID=27720 RepID=UPI003462260D